ncbi:hypothetical protein [Halorussus salinisoli]|uniref:hypothetical protein n=1 Tax=Halorussus salinisoli TaxID=2558242 RepID=UPI00148514EE|nr:hypothetical protein [Halorussus salinisoli]
MRIPFVSTADEEPNRRTDSDSGADSDREADSAPTIGLAARLTEGSKAGLVATLVMTAYRLPVSRSLPPTARFWSKFVSGDDPDDHPIAALALHLVYGTVGGAVFGALTPFDSRRGSRGFRRARSDDGDSRETAAHEALGLLWGAVYALALSVFGERVVLERVLDMDPDVDERLVFHAGHLVYGLSLGTMFGSRTSDDR